MKQHFEIYVEDRYIETIYSGWPIVRVMRHMVRKYPDAKSVEVRVREEPHNVSRLTHK